jgi:lysophospholipase L1-like esterase
MRFGRGRRRRRRRTQWPFFRFLINTMPPPVPPAGSGGGPVPNDILALIAALGGNADVPAFYDIRANVTSAAGIVSAWADARGAGFGPTLTATGSPTITGAGLSQTINTNGSTAYLKTAASALFDLSLGGSLAIGSTQPDVATILGAVAGSGDVPGMDMWPAAGNFKAFYEPAGSFVVAGGATPGPGICTMDGRMYGLLIGVNGTSAALQRWPTVATTGTLGSAAASASNILSLGTDPAHADPTAAAYRFAIYLARLFTASDAALIGQWAVQNHACFNDHPSMVVHHGDSLTVGLNLSDLTNNYPTQMSTASPFATGWANVNVGVSGQTVIGMISTAPTVVDPVYSASRLENFCAAWGGTNDIVNLGDSAATVFANLQTYINARLAVGWKVVVLTCIDRTGINETTRAAYNALITSTYGGGAVPGVAVADVAANANIGANGAASNLTYFMSDGIHLTTAGYAIVAPVVATAIESIL